MSTGAEVVTTARCLLVSWVVGNKLVPLFAGLPRVMDRPEPVNKKS